MKSSDLKFKRTTMDKVSVKGVLSDDLSGIIYFDENNAEQEVKIEDLLESFQDEQIEFSVSARDEEDLDILYLETKD